VTAYQLPTERGELRLQVASASHAGMVRAVNEDSLLAEPPVFAVADGMGGHSFGDRASATAWAAGATTIAGTTLAGLAAVVEHPGADVRWMVFNLGDSRVYRWDDADGLQRISVDHSLVQELMDAGVLDEDGARRHPDRNAITRALGAADEVHAEAWLLPATNPQTFLICSDGLTKELDDRRIAELLAPLEADESPDAPVDRLLAAALAAGGADNVSVVLVRSDYLSTVTTPSGVDEQTHERGISALAPELDDTRPRV
jgi:serine/threonine protein phosphatase PrpC